MTIRWREGGITKPVYEDIKVHEKTSKNSENLRWECFW